MKLKCSIETERNALAMALYNLCVRNNIDPKDMIDTIKECRQQKLMSTCKGVK